MKYKFKLHTGIVGEVTIDAINEDDAKYKFKQLKFADLEWRADPSKTDRKTYEVVCENSPDLTNKS